MKCPVDDTELMMSDRQGIEIDYCPKCRGVWLDRGELDKIIERSDDRPRSSRDDDRYERQESKPDYRPDNRPYDDTRRGYDDDRRAHGGDYRPHKKKKSLLGEIFDFD